MEKLKMQTKNIADENYAALAKLFPNALTETIVGYDEESKAIVERAIDVDVLRQEISCRVVEGREERYQFTWPDKRKAILLANSPVSLTLRPCKEESVDFDNTANLYIEGDNLEVLKLLQETYLGKIKMIYIDPPYNTGNDFIYKDDFSETISEYLAKSAQFDEEGNRLVSNLESKGRYHTDWLNMMYPRLKLAKNLLAEDGVIFISIDDNEIENVTKMCNEIFGEINHVCTILREAIKGGSLSRNIRNVHDYVICYSKNYDEIAFGGVEVEGINLNLEDEHGKYAKGRELNKWGAGSRREDSPSMFYPIPGPNGEEVYPIRNDGSEGRWRLGKQKMFELLKRGDAIFEPREDGTYIVYEKLRNDAPKQKQYTTWFAQDYINAKGTEELKSLFEMERAPFDFSKPTDLIKDLLVLNNDKECIVLDFFSGSATTADAVMKLNSEDGGERKFILVQLPEKCYEDSIAQKSGFNNICEIGEERIRRVGNRIMDEGKQVDVGFRVLKLDSSNMKDVYYNPAQVQQQSLFTLTDNIKEDRTPEDLLFQVMLDLGVLLSSKIEEKIIAGKKVFNVADGFLVACFDNDVTEETVRAVAQEKPYYAVFRDSSMANDSVATNFEQIFATYSPETVRKVL